LERSLAEYLSHAAVFVRTVEGEIVYWTSGCQELYGYSVKEARRRNSHDLLQTVFPAPLAEIERELSANKEWSGRLRHTTKSGQHIWTQTLWRLRNGDEPGDNLVVEQNTDITQLVQGEHRQAFLMDELNHRVKNTLAVVQGLARLTFTTRDARAAAFEDRLVALSQAHSILMREQWEPASLADVISEVVAKLHITDRITFEGPGTDLQPNAVVSYALAFHELATNALKHGALRTPGGRVEVTWRRFSDDAGVEQLHLVWRELGGPAVAPPEHEGFGSRLLRRVVAAELGTPVRLEWEPTGLVCEMQGPVQKISEFLDAPAQ
jgi:PAS domain S-box-containing protein